MNIRAASLLFAFVFSVSALPVQAQDRGGPPPNYRQLLSQVADLQARVAKLEGNITAADLAGAYSFMVLETTMRALHAGPPVVPATIDTATLSGTLTLNADGTGSGSPQFACERSRLILGTSTMQGFDCSSEPGSMGVTWTYADGVITITFLDDGDEVPLNVAVGGRLLIAAANPFHPGEPSSNHLLFIGTRLE